MDTEGGRRMLDGAGDPMADGGEASPRPVIVVQVRRGLASRLATPLLAIVAALAVLSHRVKIDDWRGVTALFGNANAPAAEVEIARPAPPRPPAPPTPPTPSVLAVATARAAPPQHRPRPMPVRPSPGRLGPSVTPLPDSGAKAALAWDDIRRDVDRARDEAVAMQDLKERAFADDQRQEPIRRADEARRLRQETEESRAAFRDDLRRALAGPAAKAGAAVEGVCQEHGVSVGAWGLAIGTASGLPLSSTARRERIEKQRARGMAEPAILDELARLEARNRAVRGGPRTRREVLVNAARQLLAVPLPSRAG